MFNLLTLGVVFIPAKNAYYRRRVRSSACPSFRLFTYISAAPPMGKIFTKLVLDTFMKICRRNTNLAKIGQTFQAVCMTTCVLLLTAT